MSKEKDEDLVNKLKDAFDSVFESSPLGSYPKEAVKIGTLVRSHRLDRLGIVTDAFYGELDEDNQKIIIYTVLIFPKQNKLSTSSLKNEQYYVTNEYEYEITAYLMMNPVDIKSITKNLGGGLFL